MWGTIGVIAVMFVGVVAIISFVYTAYVVIDWLVTKVMGF